MAYIKYREKFYVSRRGCMLLFIPLQQLNQQLHTLHDIARIVQKGGAVLQDSSSPLHGIHSKGLN